MLGRDATTDQAATTDQVAMTGRRVVVSRRIRRRLAVVVVALVAAVLLAGCGGAIGSLIRADQALVNAGYTSVQVTPTTGPGSSTDGSVDVRASLGAAPTTADVRQVTRIIWEDVRVRFDDVEITLHGGGKTVHATASFAQLQQQFGARNPAWNTTTLHKSVTDLGLFVVAAFLVVAGVVVVIVVLAVRRSRRRRPPNYPPPNYPSAASSPPGYPPSASWPPPGAPAGAPSPPPGPPAGTPSPPPGAPGPPAGAPSPPPSGGASPGGRWAPPPAPDPNRRP
jgi:hypothetical protein